MFRRSRNTRGDGDDHGGGVVKKKKNGIALGFLLLAGDSKMESMQHVEPIKCDDSRGIIDWEPTGGVTYHIRAQFSSFHSIHLTDKEFRDLVKKAFKHDDRLECQLLRMMSAGSVNNLLEKSKEVPCD